jgi:preprotein translocase subunit SecF
MRFWRAVMIDFLRMRFFAAAFSCILLGAFFTTAFYRYRTRGQVFSYSIDFTGGTQVLFVSDKDIVAEQVKEALVQAGFVGIETRTFSDKEVLVRTKEFFTQHGTVNQMESAIRAKYPENAIKAAQVDSVGASVGEAMRWKSMYAIIFAVIAMLMYIAFRFWSFAFALGAVVALFHDAFAILACFLFLDYEISSNFICAVLAVLGYSVNDTIIIFSQIKSQMKKMSHKSMAEVVNASLNATLRRTVLTTVSTALPVVSMLLFGGDALFDLPLAFMLGLLFGTYSSIYIASPVMMLLMTRQ